MQKKYLWIFLGIALVAILGYAIGKDLIKKDLKQEISVPSQTKMKVVGTFYPLAYFAEQVGGERVAVMNITPAGVEPHDFEPTLQDMRKVFSAKVFLLNGGGFDSWAEKMKSDLSEKGILVVDMQRSIPFMDARTGTEFKADPHIWLDPVLAQQEVQLIRDAFIKADPSHEDVYKKNADFFLSQLQNLDSQFRIGMASCQRKEIVTSHAAFGYLAKRYNLVQISIAGLSPDEEPSAQQLARIVELVKRHQIQYIFFETLVSPKLSETVARETGALAVPLNPLEGLTDDEIKSGKTYLTEMREHLVKLRAALQCQ